MANRNWASGGKIYSMHVKPVLLDCNFVVDSLNANGLGISSLKGPCVSAVYMNTQNGPAGGLDMASSRSYAIFGATALTNTGSSVLTGNIGEYPGSAVTGFPPGTFSGVENLANAPALLAKQQAQAAYDAGSAMTATPISSTLDGQTLTPGVYSESSGTFNLAAAGAGTLTLNGDGVYIFQCSSTLVTGAGGIPTITLSGGAKASNVYWLVGSSATINSGFAGTFKGNIIAVTSITNTLGGTMNGSNIALGGAVTLSAATAINVQPLVPDVIGAGSPNPAPGLIMVRLADNYNRLFDVLSSIDSPLSGSPLTSVVAGNAYTITSLGTASLAQWQAKGLPVGYVPAVGVSFIATASGAIGGSAAVELPLSTGSGITNIEVVGDPNVTIAGMSVAGPQGAYVILQCLNGGVLTAPADGSLISLMFYLSDSSVQLAGE